MISVYVFSCRVFFFISFLFLSVRGGASEKQLSLTLWKRPVVHLLSDYHDDRGQVKLRVDYIKENIRPGDMVLIEGLSFGESDRGKIEADPHTILLRKVMTVPFRVEGWEHPELFKRSKVFFSIFSRLIISYVQNRYYGSFDLLPAKVSSDGLETTLTLELPRKLYQVYESVFIEGVIESRNRALVSLLQGLRSFERPERQFFVVLGADHINSQLLSQLEKSFQVVTPTIRAINPHVCLSYRPAF